VSIDLNHPLPLTDAAGIERRSGLAGKLGGRCNDVVMDILDAVVCSLSIEFLTRPIEVLRELQRVHRPGAPVVVTFSDRWIPSKVIELWTEPHPFERMTLVLEYFRLAGGFRERRTKSMRGLPRPADDKYAGQLSHSDPVFAVCGFADK